MERRNWTRQELIIAFNLYCRIPFGRIHIRNPEIIALAEVLGRKPGALSWKLANFARFDPALKSRNVEGAAHGSKLERDVWDEFNQNWEQLSFESERLKSDLLGQALTVDQREVFPDGKTREALIKLRVNQGFFRSAVLASYESKCCITGLDIPELLCASHIVPWSIDHHNRTNPRNGLCLNALHDRAFDRGLMTIDLGYRIRLSPSISKAGNPATDALLRLYDGAIIRLPKRFQPDPTFLKYHIDNVYLDRPESAKNVQ